MGLLYGRSDHNPPPLSPAGHMATTPEPISRARLARQTARGLAIPKMAEFLEDSPQKPEKMRGVLVNESMLSPEKERSGKVDATPGIFRKPWLSRRSAAHPIFLLSFGAVLLFYLAINFATGGLDMELPRPPMGLAGVKSAAISSGSWRGKPSSEGSKETAGTGREGGDGGEEGGLVGGERGETINEAGIKDVGTGNEDAGNGQGGVRGAGFGVQARESADAGGRREDREGASRGHGAEGMGTEVEEDQQHDSDKTKAERTRREKLSGGGRMHNREVGSEPASKMDGRQEGKAGREGMGLEAMRGKQGAAKTEQSEKGGGETSVAEGGRRGTGQPVLRQESPNEVGTGEGGGAGIGGENGEVERGKDTISGRVREDGQSGKDDDGAAEEEAEGSGRAKRRDLVAAKKTNMEVSGGKGTDFQLEQSEEENRVKGSGERGRGKEDDAGDRVQKERAKEGEQASEARGEGGGRGIQMLPDGRPWGVEKGKRGEGGGGESRNRVRSPTGGEREDPAEKLSTGEQEDKGEKGTREASPSLVHVGPSEPSVEGREAGEEEAFVCDHSHWRTDVCTLKGDVRLDLEAMAAVLYAQRPETRKGVERIRPYPFKWGKQVMDKIAELTLISMDAGKAASDVVGISDEDSRKGSGRDLLSRTLGADMEVGGSDAELTAGRGRLEMREAGQESKAVPFTGKLRRNLLAEAAEGQKVKEGQSGGTGWVEKGDGARWGSGSANQKAASKEEEAGQGKKGKKPRTVAEVREKFKGLMGVRMPSAMNHEMFFMGYRRALEEAHSREMRAQLKAQKKTKSGGAGGKGGPGREDGSAGGLGDGQLAGQEGGQVSAGEDPREGWVHSFVNGTTRQVPRLECDVRHSVPGVVFSTGGYTGNTYHEWHNGIVPLWITAQHLAGEVALVVLQPRDWWFSKYRHVLKGLSRYPAVLAGADPWVHCFPELIVGLRIHDEVTVDPKQMPRGETIWDFQKAMKRALSGKKGNLDPSPEGQLSGCRPVLTFMAREGNRVLLNEAGVVRIAEELGFAVRVMRPLHRTLLEDMWHEMQSTDLLFGVHGAALTHFLFMRPGAAYIQVVPLGIEFISHSFLGAPAERLGLQYTEYKIDVSESSLSQKYAPDDPVLTDVQGMLDKGESALYLQHQNVTLNETRIRQVFAESKRKLQSAPYYQKQRQKVAQNPSCRELEARKRRGKEGTQKEGGVGAAKGGKQHANIAAKQTWTAQKGGKREEGNTGVKGKGAGSFENGLADISSGSGGRE